MYTFPMMPLVPLVMQNLQQSVLLDFAYRNFRHEHLISDAVTLSYSTYTESHSSRDLLRDLLCFPILLVSGFLQDGFGQTIDAANRQLQSEEICSKRYHWRAGSSPTGAITGGIFWLGAFLLSKLN